MGQKVLNSTSYILSTSDTILIIILKCELDLTISPQILEVYLFDGQLLEMKSGIPVKYHRTTPFPSQPFHVPRVRVNPGECLNTV